MARRAAVRRPRPPPGARPPHAPARSASSANATTALICGLTAAIRARQAATTSSRGDLAVADERGQPARRRAPELVGGQSPASIARTLSSRRRWRSSPLNVAPRNATTHSHAGSGPMTREPERQDVHVVVLDALVGGVRVVADRRSGRRGSCSRRRSRPTPEPQISMPRSAWPSRTAWPSRCGEVRVVVVGVGAVAAEVDCTSDPGRTPRAGAAARP